MLCLALRTVKIKACMYFRLRAATQGEGVWCSVRVNAAAKYTFEFAPLTTHASHVALTTLYEQQQPVYLNDCPGWVIVNKLEGNYHVTHLCACGDMRKEQSLGEIHGRHMSASVNQCCPFVIEKWRCTALALEVWYVLCALNGSQYL